METSRFTLNALTCVWVLCMGTVCGAGAFAELPERQKPIIYYISYTDAYFKTPAFIDGFKKAPPDIVHLGKAVPITHNWGPVPVMMGENQYTGGPKHTLNRDAIRLLTPKELEEKMEVIKEGVRRLHEAGVKVVVPYIGSQTLMGDEQTRQGFWNFYDHWDTYEKWLGPKPKDDPSTWLVRGAAGKPAPGLSGGYSPPYIAPLHRYRACVSNPNWRDFHRHIVKLIAECGYDGVFPDNVTSGGDLCPYCQAAFKEWLKDTYTEAALKEMCKVENVADINLSTKTFPAHEMAKFRVGVMCDYLLMLRDEGRKVNPDFVVFPNMAYYENCLRMSEACEYYMLESPFTSGITIPDEPPEDRYCTVDVVEALRNTETGKFEASNIDPETFIEFAAQLEYPKACTVRTEQVFKLNVTKVGASKEDADAAEDLHLVLTRTDGGEQVRLDFEPSAVGNPKVVKGAVYEPQLAAAKWRPLKPGRYRMALGYKYTDLDHRKETLKREQVHLVTNDGTYRSHSVALQCLLYARARVVFLDYASRQGGRERLLELSMAECAAFGTAATACKDATLVKFHDFFAKTRDLYEKSVPWGDVGVLFAYWGTNAGQPRGSARYSSADYLSENHFLWVPLMDRYMSAEDLRPLKAVFLAAQRYEMSDEQLGQLVKYVMDGGALVFDSYDVTFNGKAVGDIFGLKGRQPETAFGKGKVIRWNIDEPYTPFSAVASAAGRLRGVRFAAYVSPGDGREIMLHAVNYNVTATDKMGVLTPIEKMKVTLPLPRGMEVVGVNAFDPDMETGRALEFAGEAGRAVFTVPKLNVYQVIQIRLK